MKTVKIAFVLAALMAVGPAYGAGMNDRASVGNVPVKCDNYDKNVDHRSENPHKIEQRVATIAKTGKAKVNRKSGSRRDTVR